MTWKNGDIIQGGKYKINYHLGSGGWGIVYLATDDMSRNVAIKVLKDELKTQNDYDKVKQDFINEARRLAQFSDLPYIIKIYDLIQEDDKLGIVMEYIEGDSLDWCGTLSEELALSYIQQVSSSLAEIHKRGLLHRDIKPSNILVRDEPKEAILIDFGIAREFTPETIQTHTIGFSDFYSAPEQYDPRAIRTASSDIYSLSATLYKMLTNKEPEGAISRRDCQCTLKTPKQINPNISDAVESAILKGLELQAYDRPQSVKEWLEIMGLSLISISEYKVTQSPLTQRSIEETITEIKEKSRIRSRVEFYIKELSTTDSQSRKTAIQELGRLGEKAFSAVSSLIKIMEDIDDILFHEVGRVLIQIGSASVIPLSLLLDHDKVEIRRKAASTLEHFGTEASAATPQIIKALEDIDYEVRLYATKTIGKIGLPAKDAIPSLIKILKKETSIRSNNLSSVGTDTSLLSALGTDTLGTNALLTLGIMGVEAQSAIPVILEILRDIKSSYHTLSLLNTLEEIGYDINTINFYYIDDGITRNGKEHILFQKEELIKLKLEAQQITESMPREGTGMFIGTGCIISLPCHAITVFI